MSEKQTVKKAKNRKETAAPRTTAAAGARAKKASTGASKKGPKTAKKSVRKASPGKSAAKPASRRPVAKKTAAPKATPAKKKASAVKANAKKTPAKKTTAGKTVAKKAVAKKPAAEKPAVEKSTAKVSVSTTGLPPVRPDPRLVAHKAVHAARGGKPKKLGKRESESLRELLVAMRRRLSQQVSMLKDESLYRNEEIITGEEGTDVFDRQFALNLASSEQEAIYDIDVALRRIDEGVYGICEDCGCVIGIERLKALPFVRSCVQCQSEKERNRPRFKPFE